MALSDQEKLDILWKKLGGVAQTSSNNQLEGPKDIENETYSSPQALFSKDIWTYAEQILENPPYSSNGFIEIVNNLEMTRDTTSIRAFVAILDDIVPKRLTDWIPPSFGPAYNIKVYIDGVYTPSNNETLPWYFDYMAGILYFTTAVPTGTVAVSGYRYVGRKGLLDQARMSPLLYEVTTPILEINGTYEFEAQTGTNIKLVDLWIDDTTLAGTDPLFHECECMVECHWYSGYNSSNPYTFKAMKLHLQDDGTYYVNGQAYSGPRFVDLINLEFPESGVTYWKITKINQRGRVHFKFHYLPNA